MFVICIKYIADDGGEDQYADHVVDDDEDEFDLHLGRFRFADSGQC